VFSDKAQKAIRAELENGYRARSDGLDGRARVCARRAAGEAAKEYFRLADEQQSGSALDLLGVLVNRDEISARARAAAAELLKRVDEDFNLEAGVDLLEEAQVLAVELERLAVLRWGGGV
jgi:hypothetical protein